MTRGGVAEQVVWGLRARNDERTPIPLEGVAVEARLDGLAARVTVFQRYRNREAHPIEAVYVFPVDEAAAVCGFEARIGETRIVGRVKEREAAFADYDDALLEGHGAYLLDEERADVFTASVGNVPPGQSVELQVTTLAPLAYEGERLRFILPTTVSPRYAPREDRVGVGRPPAEALNPPVEPSVPYGLDLSITLDMPAPIRGVECPSHPVQVALDETRGRVQLSQREVALDRDFVLLVDLQDQEEPRVRVERGPEGRPVAALFFRPRYETREVPVDAVFLVDRSGSMNGSSIAEARNALQLCLRSLPQGSAFNVVGFGSTFEMLFPESRPYNDTTLAEASRHVAGLTADLGGTEILPPLAEILKRDAAGGLPRQLFVLTDGEITNTDAVIDLLRRHAGATRVFLFGIGFGPSHHLVRAAARAGGGAAEFILPGERLEPKVLRQLRRALTPGLSDVRIEWGELRVVQAPFRIPPAFAGEPLRVLALLEDDRAGEVTLRGMSPSGPVACAVPVDPSGARPGELVPTLWARERIRDLEEGASELHGAHGSAQADRREARVKAEIVRVGAAYGLASRETSFVAIEERETPVAEPAQLRRIPVALTKDWGGIWPVPAHPRAAFRLPGLARLGAAAFCSLPSDGSCGSIIASDLPSLQDSGLEAGERPLDRLVALQHSDGSWDLTPEFADAVGISLRRAEALLKRCGGDPAMRRRALATQIALLFLERHAADARDQWDLLARKARRWLDAAGVSLPDHALIARLIRT